VLADFRQRMGDWERVRTGRAKRDDFDVWGFRASLGRVAEVKPRDAVGDLTFLLDNAASDEPFTDDLAVSALDALRDDRAVLPLLVKVLSQDTGGEDRILEAARRVGRPLSEQLLPALKDADVVTRRRALAVVVGVARDEFNRKARVKLSDAERAQVAPSAEVRAQIEALCADPNVSVRYDALVAHLLLNGGDASKVRARFAGEKSGSVLLLLKTPDLAMNPRRVLLADLPPQAPPEPPPPPEAFKVVSPWVTYRKVLSRRVSMTTDQWACDEPLAVCNKPVWVRCELRNDSDAPANASLFISDTISPDLYLSDGTNGREPIALVETYTRKDAGQGAEPGMLAPGVTYAWRVRVTPPKVERNGSYVILPGAAPAFTVKVTGVPDPLWLTRYPPPGHDPRKVYFPPPAADADVFEACRRAATGRGAARPGRARGRRRGRLSDRLHGQA
jgi:hypothetical protein